MPTYQYACTTCGNQLEVVQSFTDAALTECPVCEGQLRKVFSAVGIVFKGSGFYRTDSRAGASATDSGAKADGAKADGAKSDGNKSDGNKESTSTPAKSEGSASSTSTSTTSTTTTPPSSSSSSSSKAAAS